MNPIRDESMSDGSYNQVNTLSYNVTLILAVISIAAILRKVGMPATEFTIFALLPWVIWASLGEVVEDATLFGPELESWFVSPGYIFREHFGLFSLVSLHLLQQNQVLLLMIEFGLQDPQSH